MSKNALTDEPSTASPSLASHTSEAVRTVKPAKPYGFGRPAGEINEPTPAPTEPHTAPPANSPIIEKSAAFPELP